MQPHPQLTHTFCFSFLFLLDQKDENGSGKTEESAKLQNGDSAKDGVAAGASEEKKKAKSRFMFNIADGGFTGRRNSRLPFSCVCCFG